MNLPKYALKEVNKGNSVKRYFCVKCKVGRYFGDLEINPKCLKCGSQEMLEVLRSLSPEQKEKIKEFSGGKCANPGCSARRTHIHHIDEWAIYHSDDLEILIPVCPSCHDQIHHGKLPISRETLIHWKNIIRKRSIRNLHIYVEPGENFKFRVGGLWLSISPEKMKLHLFQLSPNVKVKFKIEGNKISLADISICDVNGNLAIEVLSNYIEVIDPLLNCNERNGHVKITSNDIERYLPNHLLKKFREQEPNYAENSITILEIEVTSPGEMALKGCWYEDNEAFIMTDLGLYCVPLMASFVSKDSDCSVTYTGDQVLFSTKNSSSKMKALRVNAKKKEKLQRKAKRKLQKRARRKNSKARR